MLREQGRQTSQEMRLLPPAGHLGAEGSGGTSPGQSRGSSPWPPPPPQPPFRCHPWPDDSAVSENQPGKT